MKVFFSFSSSPSEKRNGKANRSKPLICLCIPMSWLSYFISIFGYYLYFAKCLIEGKVEVNFSNNNQEKM